MSTEAVEGMRGDDVRAWLRTALAAATARLGAAGVPSPSVDARALIAAAADTERPLVLLDALPADVEDRLEALLARREAREPLQLILGEAPFRRLMLRVRPGVFVPRPETELALDLLAAHQDAPPRRVVDLCTGSGALAAAVLDELPQAEVLAVDLSPEAVELAAENLEAAGHGRGRVLRADLAGSPGDADPALAGLAAAAGVDAVLSNPPYVPPDAAPRDPEVARHDPAAALYGGGAEGLELPRQVLRWARHLLRPGGLLVMEHADVQGEVTRALAAEVGGFGTPITARDLTGRDRFLVVRRAIGPAQDKDERLTP
ncbi:N5-glutamine methyltransferase family protein [Brachybacterium squillarum]|uniref:N5-glutamine methyltransferase family protein n=1 Tax=Brachybacterium squillarum TaxID=661979 RepID=UPI00026296BF|nr:HemK/PrmC family methyltransferase [Brachybacterium squillarum]